MDNFSYTDNVRAALSSCLPCFTTSHSKTTLNPSSPGAPSDPRSTSIRPSSADLEHLLQDADSDALSLHSNLGAPAHRRRRRRRRPKFSLTLFGYTLFGRPPVYLSDDDDDDDDDNSDSPGVGGGRPRPSITASSSTLDSDAALLDASTIERLTSPDHFAVLVAQRAQRERERQQLEAEEAAHRKSERRARRQERKTRARTEALESLNGRLSPRPDLGTFEGFQGSGQETVSASIPAHLVVEAIANHAGLDRLGGHGNNDGSHSGDADDADLGGGLYTQKKKKTSAAWSASGSDSRSRTSTSFSVGDVAQSIHTHTIHQPIPYPHTEMHLPPSTKKSHRTSKRTSIVSSVTSQSTSTTPYTPVESVMEGPGVVAFPVVTQDRNTHTGEHTDFPSVGLAGKRGPNAQDLKTFLAQQG